MAYDRELAARLRGFLADQPDLSEKAMFGGLAFLVNGHMAVAAGSDGIMVRVDPERSEALLDDGADRMVMNDRELDGWLRVSDEKLVDGAGLQRWATIGVDYARTLPPK